MAGMVTMLLIASLSSVAGQGLPQTGLQENDGLTFVTEDQQMTQAQQHIRMRQLSALGEPHNMFSQLTYSDGTATGYFIQFEYDESTGEISDYEVRTGDSYEQVFQKVTLSGFEPEDMSVHGSIMSQFNETCKMIVHSNPTAMIHTASNVSSMWISFLLADGLNVTELQTNGSLDAAVRLSQGSIGGMIGVGNGTLTVEEVEAGVYVNITVIEGSAFFRMTPFFSMMGAANELLVETALEEGQIAAEATVMHREGDTICVEQSYQHQYQMRLLTAHQNMIRLEVSSQLHQGKVMMVKFDRQTMDASDGVKVTLDGQEVRASDSVDEVLQGTGSQMQDASYCLIDNGEEYALLAYVPSFSTHVLEIESDSESGLIPITLIGLGLVAALLVIIAIMARK
jgi:hypothetical protein